MSLGTPQTLFILDEMDKDNLIAAPMSWYSGWSYKSVDKGLVIEFGAAYCADGMNSVDWALANYPVDVKTIGIMGWFWWRWRNVFQRRSWNISSFFV